MSAIAFQINDIRLDHQKQSVIDFGNLNNNIKNTFTALERFEWQVINELRLMRDNHYYLEAGYKSFEEYCNSELAQYGGYRRVRDLLAAKKVVDTLPDELKFKITKPSQTRPLQKLINTPEILHQAVEIASLQKPFPTTADFARAVERVAPRKTRTKNSGESKTQMCKSVRISSQSHPRNGDEGVIETDAPNNSQQIVTFLDGEKMLVNNGDLEPLDAPLPAERIYPKEYSETIAAIEEQHRQTLERLEQDLRVGLQAEATARAEESIQEQLQAFQQLLNQQKQENIRLQQRLDEMESLRQLEFENERLKERVEELENLAQQQPLHQWDNTFTQQATKVLNEEVKKALENTIDLRSLAYEAPQNNVEECLWLMGLALGNLAVVMNNTQALQAAAIILGVEPRKEAISFRAKQLQELPIAVSSIREILRKPGCTWEEFWAVAQNYRTIEKEYRAEFTAEEINLIDALKNHIDDIQVGSIVSHADPYFTLSKARGEVVEDFGEEVMVAWEHWKNESRKQARYLKTELRLV